MDLRSRSVAAFGVVLCLALSVASAEPAEVVVFTTEPAPAVSSPGDWPQVLRRYEVREDAATGRLVRVRAGRARSAGTAEAGRARSNEAVEERFAPRAEVPAAGRIGVDALVRQTGRRHGVAPALIHAVIRQESNYDWLAVSKKGASGLMQLMPGTADRFGVKNIFDPAENVEGGVKYLRHLLDRYDGDSSLALAAYNAGEGAVDQYGGIPPYRETIDYVGSINRLWRSSSSSVSSGSVGSASTGAYRPRVVARETTGVIRFEME